MSIHDDFAERLDDQIAGDPMDCRHVPPWCRYQCPAHHGVTTHVNSCPSADLNRAVCIGCTTELQLIQARIVRRMRQRQAKGADHEELTWDFPDYDTGGPVPPEHETDPEDAGVWAIWEGGPMAAGHRAAEARCDRWWRENGNTETGCEAESDEEEN